MIQRKLLLPIAAFSYLVACQPLPEPVTNLSQLPAAPPQEVPADNQTIFADTEKVAETKTPVIIPDNQTISPKEPEKAPQPDDEAQANQSKHDEAASHDDQPQADISADDSASDDSASDDIALGEEVGKKLAEQTPPPPLPDPYNPVQLVGKTDHMVKTTLGQADYSFTEQGIMIWHYKQKPCQILVFISDRPDDKRVLHVDIRAPLLGTDLLPSACYQAVGNRVFEVENN
ncbi:MAG: hypothetical protein ACON49_03075 [Candidatus Puniceispirillaceae bacterium]